MIRHIYFSATFFLGTAATFFLTSAVPFLAGAFFLASAFAATFFFGAAVPFAAAFLSSSAAFAFAAAGVPFFGSAPLPAALVGGLPSFQPGFLFVLVLRLGGIWSYIPVSLGIISVPDIF